MPVIKPAGLRRGDSIGVISPAGPLDETGLQSGIEILESSGFKVRLAHHVYSRLDYLAGEDEARLEDLHGMFRDSDIKAVFCARGGYGTTRLLDKIKYDLIRQNPKILVGYSDITALLLAIQKRTGLITFHGPVVRELASGHQGNYDNLISLLSSDKPLKLSLAKGNVLIPGRATGSLIGGNLSLICHLIGTPFLPSLDGCILFMEDREEPLYRIDRMLTHLKLSGQLGGLSGLVAGKFEECGDTSTINGLLMDVLSDLDIPIATGLEVGHGHKNLSLPLGLPTELDTDRLTLSVTEVAVEDSP
ncbi:MAG: LD-carboxypeptidase [Deltaproteobacteria bacterium]|nr:LD-carboxypeptidase [Deltaproteobacteria bacterium]